MSENAERNAIAKAHAANAARTAETIWAIVDVFHAENAARRGESVDPTVGIPTVKSPGQIRNTR